MKKLYQGKGRQVHPAPADAAVVLPAAVLALASALTAEEQEVLAYLLSCGGAAGGAGVAGARRRSSSRRGGTGAHPPEMGCGCFGCYKSFWARWDASPNRHLIHRIIDAVEEGANGGSVAPPRRPSRRRRRGRRSGDDADADADEEAAVAGAELPHLHPGCDEDHGSVHGDEYEADGDNEEGSSVDSDDDESFTGGDCDGDCNNNGDSAEKSTVGRLVRFIGDKVWGAWN